MSSWMSSRSSLPMTIPKQEAVLPEPTPPILFGGPHRPAGKLLPWAWAERRSPTLETAGSRTVHLKGGDEVVIVVVEGAAERVSDHAAKEPMSEAYSSNYNWPICPRRDEVTDSDGNASQVFRVTPEVVFGWKMCEATRPQGQRLERGQRGAGAGLRALGRTRGGTRAQRMTRRRSTRWAPHGGVSPARAGR